MKYTKITCIRNILDLQYLWTSSRGQVLSSTVAEKETDRSTQTTALWRLMEKVNLLVSKLLLAVHYSSKWITVPPVSIAWCVAFIGALEQLRDSSMIQGPISEETSLENFFLCYSCCGQNVDLDREEGAGGPTIARSLSCARSFVMSVSACWVPLSGERKREQSRKSGRRDLLKWTSIVFFSLHCKTVAC